VAGGILARMDVEVVDEQVARNAVDGRERVDELVPRLLETAREVRVQLDAVTGLEHRVLEHDRTALGARPERADALAQLDGGGAMTETEADQAVHA
jgi:hypothetical protein